MKAEHCWNYVELKKSLSVVLINLFSIQINLTVSLQWRKFLLQFSSTGKSDFLTFKLRGEPTALDGIRGLFLLAGYKRNT